MTIDRETRQRFDAAVWRAVRGGRDLGEYLDQYGFLATPQRVARKQAEAVERAAEEIGKLTLPDLIGARYHTGNYTAFDVVTGVQRRLQLMAEEVRKGSK